jgi:hypothetical protein
LVSKIKMGKSITSFFFRRLSPVHVLFLGRWQWKKCI